MSVLISVSHTFKLHGETNFSYEINLVEAPLFERRKSDIFFYYLCSKTTAVTSVLISIYI